MTDRSSAHRASFVLAALSGALVAGLYGRLPDPMPTHWNLRGEVDGFTPKPWGPLLLPLATAFAHAVFAFVRRRAPQVFADKAQGRLLGLVQFAVVAFLSAVTLASCLVALGVALPWNRVLCACLGALVVALGVAMHGLRKNPYVGIRTPWTLANDEVWAQTHRMGARMFVVAGLIAVVFGGSTGELIPVLIAVGIASVAPVVFSFSLYRKLEGNKPPRPS